MNSVFRACDLRVKRSILTKTLQNILRVNYSRKTEAIDIESVSAADETEILEHEIEVSEQEIELKRNKSRLYSDHRNIVHERVPHTEPVYWTHETLKYKRRMYGLYGKDSGVNPAIAWPSREELEDIREFESVKYPETLQEIVQRLEQSKLEEEKAIKEREQQIITRMAKLEQWKKELNDKIKKKEADALAAKAKKDRLVEEVRQLFGYKVDPKDERFKEMLEKKEKEEKKLARETRRKEKEAKAMAKLLAMGGKTAEAKPE